MEYNALPCIPMCSFTSSFVALSFKSVTSYLDIIEWQATNEQKSRKIIVNKQIVRDNTR